MQQYGVDSKIYEVPYGLSIREYKEALKQTQKEIDTRMETIRKYGIDSPTGIFVDIYKQRYIEKKEKIKRMISFGQKKGSELNIQKAKQFPIPSMIEVNRAGFTKCPFHEEKTPSAKYYTKDNRLHCFGSCGKSFDSIDVYMKISNVDFITAVKALS